MTIRDDILTNLLMWTKPIRYAIDKFTYQRTEFHADIEKLKNKYAGKPLLIVGNGPSLNKTPLDEFVGVPAIGMNKIDLIYSRTLWRPSFVVCMNNLVIKQNRENFINSDIPVFISWKGRWFIPRKIRSHFNFFLDLAGDDFSIDAPAGVGSSGTVTYTALQFAYYVGADPVIIVGVDHSFKTEAKPHTIERRVGEDNNHFDPNYFASGQLWGVPNLEASEIGYLKARKEFEKANRKIFDATVDGKLQIFEKIQISEAIAMVRS